jgi:hypothetical protein
MFIEQPVNIWLTRVAMEKYFRKSNIRRKQTGDEGKAQAVKSSPTSIQIDLSRFKCNPRSHEGVDDDISSDKCAESLQSLLNSVENPVIMLQVVKSRKPLESFPLPLIPMFRKRKPFSC